MKNVFYRMRKSKTLAIILAISMLQSPVYAEGECSHASFGDWTTTTPATCTSAGVKTRKCNNCEHTETEPVAALGHSSGPWKVTTNPSCTSAGEETRTCTVCGTVTESQPIPSTGHTWGEEQVTTPATCEGYGKKISVCENAGCNAEEDRGSIAPLGHAWGTYTIETPATCTVVGIEAAKCTRTGCEEVSRRPYGGGGEGHHMVEVDRKNPTCTADGYVLMKCDKSSCGVEETTVLPADPAKHEYGYGDVITKATCETPGSHATKCIYCGAAGTPEPIPALGGSCYFLYDVNKSKTASCKEDGYKTYVCMTCGNEKVETISKDTVPHSPVDDYVKKEATCKEEGVYATKCLVCGNATADRVIPITLCSMEVVPELTVPASCDKDGYHVLRCTVCEKEEKETILAITVPHAWVDDYVKHEPTCQMPGLMITKCSACGLEGMREIPEEHNYSETGRTPASCFTDGTAEYKCDTCGTEKSEILKAVGSHTWKKTSSKKATCTKKGEKKFECTVCGEVKKETVKATGKHNWKQEASALATCSENGFIQYGCTSCNKEKTTTLPATGAHNFSEWIVIKEATQVAAGEMQCTCIHCGYVLTKTIEPELPEKEIVGEKDVETTDKVTDDLTETIETITGTTEDALETLVGSIAELDVEKVIEDATAEQNTETLMKEANGNCCQHIAGEYGAYELAFCEEHQLLLEMEDTLMANAETEAERVKVLKQIQGILKIEAEYMYDEWIAQAEGEEQELAAAAKAVFEANFHTQLATWNLMYGEDSEMALTRSNELLCSQCVDLCIMTAGMN